MLVLIFISILGTSMAQVPFLGSCPQLKTMESFDVGRYLGKWYEAERYFAAFQVGGKCASANYSVGADANTIVVLNQQENTITGGKSKVEGTAKVAPSGVSSQLVVKFPNAPVEGSYWVLDTDYDNYAVVWSCRNFGVFHTRIVWILTRERNPPLETMEKAGVIVDMNSISRTYFMKTDQKNCPEDL